MWHLKAAYYGVFVVSVLLFTVLFANNLWPRSLPWACGSFCVRLPWGTLSSLRQEILFFSWVIITLSIFLLFRLQFIQLLRSSSGAFGVYPTIKHLLPSSTFLTFWMPRLRAKKLLTPMWSIYGKPTGTPTRYAQECLRSFKNVVAKMEWVTCDQKNKILACLGGDVVWLGGSL